MKGNTYNKELQLFLESFKVKYTHDKITALMDNSNIAYLFSYIGVFLIHFHIATIFVYMYLQYVFIFQPQDTVDVQNLLFWKKCLIWKFLITFFIILLSILLPFEEQTIPLQLFAKGEQCDR